MISDKQNLIFALHGALYGIDAASVREICWLPELYSLATAPPDIIGMFDWRSQMVPVMHLDLRFGHNFSGCNSTDRAIVVEWQNTYVAIVAHDVLDVESIEVQAIDLDLFQGRQNTADLQFVTGIARLNETPVMCLDLDRLIRDPHVVELGDDSTRVPTATNSDFYSRCFPQATQADRSLFANRALQLKTEIVTTQGATEAGILSVQIGAQYIGIPLDLVVDVDALDRFSLSPVPLAPRYILGQTDWRGKILPILELGSVLRIPTFPRQEFVVVDVNNVFIGIAVDRIFDATYLADSEIDSLPISIDSKLRTYLRGVTKYADSMMYILRLQELVEREFLPASATA
jgi:purine-binding chemotaxis protein CheW